MKNKIIGYDVFKFIVTIIFVLIFLVLLFNKPEGTPHEFVSNTVEEESEINIIEDESSGAQFPPFPITDGSLEFDKNKLELLDGDGARQFRLSDDKQYWEPIIPKNILSKLPDGYSLEPDGLSSWSIKNQNSDLLYSYDIAEMNWMLIRDQSDSIEAAALQEDAGNIPVCEKANSARITSVGSMVEVVHALIPLRSSPKAESKNLIMPLPKGTILEITEFPVCTPFLTGANLWWRVRTENGTEGWAAEGSAISDVYYLQEIN